MQVIHDDGRVLALEGGHNFRDIGGYPVLNGGSVRWERVYRSGVLEHFTTADLHRLSTLGVLTICDLRSNSERRNHPTRWPDTNLTEHWSRDHEDSVGDLMSVATAPTSTPDDTRRLMIEMYQRLPYEQAGSYRVMFERIASGGVPLVVHCAAGKDRTGVAVALLLEVLGVSRADIIKDYCQTEQFFEGLLRLARSNTGGWSFDGVPQDVWEPLLRAEPAYIMAMFDALERRHGSVATYLAEVLDVDAARVSTIRAAMLVYHA